MDNLSNQTAALLPIRDAFAFEYKYPLGLPGKAFQGDDYYLGDNLGSEAIITYYLKDEIKTKRDQRLKRERDTTDDRYPSYDELKAEKEEEAPYLLFTIKDTQGQVVRKLTTTPSTGINRIHWDLRFASTNPINLRPPAFYNPWGGNDKGTLVPPGPYTVTFSKFVDGKFTDLGAPVTFYVKSLNNTVLPAEDRMALATFQDEVTELSRVVNGAQNSMRELNNELKHIKAAITKSSADQKMLMQAYTDFNMKLRRVSIGINGDRVKAQLDMNQPMSVAGRLGNIQYEMFYSTSNPTETHKKSLAIAKEEFQPYLVSLRKLIREDLVTLQAKLEDAGAPYTPNRVMIP